MQRTAPLIRTKLRLPFVRPGLVSRPQLQEQIAQGLRGPFTLITAPAGFGKTTLAASCVAACGIPVAWLSLDKEDNQAGRFLAYLIAALHNADDRIGSEAAQLMAGMQQVSPEAVLVSLINDLDTAVEDIILVLDDYQFVSSQAVHAGVAFLLDHCPQSLHLLVATRSDPPLPLARLRARGQMVELRTADLRFTALEAAKFLNDVMGLGLDAGLIAALEERTEGWVAGLQMAALSMRDRKDIIGFIEGFSGTNRYILDYLLEEVLASQPPEIQRFLLSTSILERLAAPLCDVILAEDENPAASEHRAPALGTASLFNSTPVLEYLERENLFLVPLDDERIWFRYHHLFADLLRSRLHQAQPDQVFFLRRRASAWLEQNGFIPEAIQHLLAASDINQAADLIERYGPSSWAESDLSVVQMAENLPREMLITRPKLGLYHAWLLVLQGLVEKAFPLLKDLAQRLAASGPEPGQRWIQTIVTLSLAFLTPPSIASELYPLPDERLLDEIPANEVILRDAADILYGMTLGRRGEFDRAVEFSVKCIHKAKLLGGTSLNPKETRMLSNANRTIPTLVPFLATIYIFQGRLHAAASLSREFLEPVKEKGIRIATAGNLDIILGYVLYQWNCLDEAEQHLRDGLRANQPWGNIMTDALGMAILTHVLRNKGDYGGAMQIVDKFETRLQEPTRPIEFAEDFRTLNVRVRLASGDLQAAADWADQILLSDDYGRYPGFYRLTLARIRLAQKRYAEVEEVLAGKPTQAVSGDRIVREIETQLILAAAIAGQQRMAEAFEILAACLILGEPEGYLQVFLDGGEPVRDLLAAYVQSGAHGQFPYAQKLLGVFSPSGRAAPPCPQPASLVEPLSEREIEVLRLMSQGSTNQEIARQLVVAPGTIKAHAASIYRKLDVANRTEAVTRARQMGILP